MFCFLLLELSLGNHACAQAPADKPMEPTPTVRPCGVHKEGSKSSRKDKARKKANAALQETAIACVEARDSALNIQEFFQSYLRSQAWQFSEERIVADGWIFARYFDKDELLQFAREGPFVGRVTWTGGKAVVLVATRELDDGYTQVEVSARVQGFGHNVDRFAPARDTWDLDSTGLLERTLIAALEDHFKSLHVFPKPQMNISE